MASKFSSTMYVTAYELSRDGLSNAQIARTLGVVGITFRGWVKKNKALADALKRGRHVRDPGPVRTFHDYIYDHLEPKLRELWNKIHECATLENSVERTEALLGKYCTRTRQHLFLYALTQSMFNVSQSLRKLCIPRQTFQSWCSNDPDFQELMDEIHWYKQNFFEQAFIGRVAAGDTHAIIHAVKTKCRSRGYNEKVEVIHSGQVEVKNTFSVVDLDLDIPTRRKILDATRKKKKFEEGSKK